MASVVVFLQMQQSQQKVDAPYWDRWSWAHVQVRSSQQKMDAVDASLHACNFEMHGLDTGHLIHLPALQSLRLHPLHCLGGKVTFVADTTDWPLLWKPFCATVK